MVAIFPPCVIENRLEKAFANVTQQIIQSQGWLCYDLRTINRLFNGKSQKNHPET
jgi:hypothetical protein